MINRTYFLRGMKYAAYTSVITFVIMLLYYLLILYGSGASFIGIYSFFTGGILLVVAGCIGPGRYFERYKLMIVSPGVSGSFFEHIPISAISVGDIAEAKVMINGELIDTISFDENMGQILVPRSKVEEATLNELWLDTGDDVSNFVSFTFFEFNENMSDEEIEEFSHYDDQMSIEALKQQRQDYMKKYDSSPGSMGLGFLTTAFLIMLVGIIGESVF
ncbi:MAG: hypothetical protein INQ03_25260 [Candidatus Heimdallarchaeota archaeon]|nr:hypothetical protein [Candidatus Heimdallarchaeota archaeon]